jgi:hypothetical protein
MLGSTIRAADLEPCENQGADYSVIREMQRNIIFSYVFRRYSPVQFRMKTECLYLPFFSICKRLQSACLQQSACSCERTIFCLDRTPLLPTHPVTPHPSPFWRPLPALQRSIPGRVLASSDKGHRRPAELKSCLDLLPITWVRGRVSRDAPRIFGEAETLAHKLRVG